MIWDHKVDYATISLEELAQLREDSALLHALEAAGVDNWEGYGEALRELENDDEGEEGDY